MYYCTKANAVELIVFQIASLTSNEVKSRKQALWKMILKVKLEKELRVACWLFLVGGNWQHKEWEKFGNLLLWIMIFGGQFLTRRFLQCLPNFKCTVAMFKRPIISPHFNLLLFRTFHLIFTLVGRSKKGSGSRVINCVDDDKCVRLENFASQSII